MNAHLYLDVDFLQTFHTNHGLESYCSGALDVARQYREVVSPGYKCITGSVRGELLRP